MNFQRKTIKRNEWVWKTKDGVIPLQPVQIIIQFIFVAAILIWATNISVDNPKTYYSISKYIQNPECKEGKPCFFMENHNGNLVWQENKNLFNLSR